MAFFSFKAAAPVVFVVVTVLAQLQAEAFVAKGLCGNDQREFDYFILALQWAGTSCRDKGECCPYNGCCRGAHSPTQFTIHGLWPEYEGNERPSCCSNSIFNPNEIIPFFGQLIEYWPTYRCALEQSCNDRKEIFWGQQYEKHGTCASPVIKGEHDYFKKTLQLFFKYNVNKALEDAGIVASNSKMYLFQDIVVAVESAVGARPMLRCNKEGLVKEIWLCFDKDFKPRDCDASESCPMYVSLPEITKPMPDMVKGSAIPWKAGA